MIWIKRYFCSLTILIAAYTSFAQGTSVNSANNCKPPKFRELFHDYVDREQSNILKLDGIPDKELRITQNEDINFLVSQALVTRVDNLQCKIESDTTMGDQVKKFYLRGIERLLKNIAGNIRSSKSMVASIPTTIDAYESAMELDKKGESIQELIASTSYESGNAVIKSGTFDKNPGYKASTEILIRKYCEQHPERVFATLKDNFDVSFRDSIIKVASYKYPRQLYDYAAANNKFGYAIRKIDDPLIQAVSKMATSNSGQIYFPFLDNIMKGKMTISDIENVRADSVQYYKMLVKTHIDYLDRALNGEVIYESQALTKMLEKKAVSIFVNTINGLHDLEDPARFRIIQQLSAEELYYLIIASDGVIYTSSYTRGVYPLMMSKMNNRGDSLLMSVRFDKYRKFIKMAAGYNTLSKFLSSFPDEEHAKKLMRAFVGGLEKSDGLEDGVDVADSYASISETIKPIADEMLSNIKINYERNLSQNNKRGIVIYNLLNKLFLSADSTNKIDLSKEFGIAPVYEVANNTLVNDKGVTVAQVFFYGDKDGQVIFPGFLRQFANSNWKTTSTDKWVAITSTKGKPIMIFANKPLPEEGGHDAAAQKALGEYLTKEGLDPTIVIHRGHSYYAPYTIEQIRPSSKIVFMGSCGGYHLINDILKHAPDAHIIASKQIGKTAINQPFFNLLTEKVLNGNDIEWIPFWKEFEDKVPNRVEGLEDYIPPHKNLGAIFIKAYKSAMGETEETDDKL